MSLFDEVDSKENVQDEVDESAKSKTESEWYWDDGIAGEGPRPSYLSPKYKSVAQAAKAQKELESKLGSAPEKYSFEKAESWIEPEYESFQKLAEFAKSKHVPQEVMDVFLESVTDYLDAFKPDIESEKKALGENYKQRLTTLNNWAKSNLSEESFNALASTMRTADSIKAIEEIREKMMSENTIIPTNQSSESGESPTMEEYRSKLQNNFEKYQKDPIFRKEMTKMLEKIEAASS